MEEELLPKFDYHLDESDPDITVLRRQDGSFVAAFSTGGATEEGIIEAAKDDYAALLEAHAGPLGLHAGAEEDRGGGARSPGAAAPENGPHPRWGG